MNNIIISICFIVILIYLSLFNKNDKFLVKNVLGLHGESEECETMTKKKTNCDGLHINMHCIDGVANIFSPEIHIDQ